MATYCTAFYTRQNAATELYPAPDLQSRFEFDQLASEDASATEKLLTGLTPPAGLADTFAEFVENAHRITVDRQAMARSVLNTGDDGPAGNAFDRAITARWGLASELHAAGCDGKLPPAQKAAVVKAVRYWETTEDSVAVCRDLSTPGFLMTRWSDYESPLNGCISTRQDEASYPGGLPHDIVVTKVTGADGVSATVYYTLVGGCGCGSDTVTTRVLFLDGKWLVSQLGD